MTHPAVPPPPNPTDRHLRGVQKVVGQARLSAVESSETPIGGSGDDFAAWVRPHLAAMGQLAARLGPVAQRDDIVQESLLRAWRRWETYRPERGSPRVWLLAIVADRARRASRRAKQVAPSPPVSVSEADVDLELAIASLPRRQRLAVELRYIVGLGTAETAAVMGCAEGTVKSTLADARARLREKLGER